MARNPAFFVGSVVPQVVVSQGHRRDATNLRARQELGLGSPPQVEIGRKKRISIFLGASADFWAGVQALGARWAETHCPGLCKPVRA